MDMIHHGISGFTRPLTRLRYRLEQRYGSGTTQRELTVRQARLRQRQNEGVFLGYHIQPGFAWKGEFLVAKLEGLDYHIEHASLTVQQTKRIELPSDEFIFPMRLLEDPSDAKAQSDPVPLERGQALIEEHRSNPKRRSSLSCLRRVAHLIQAECLMGRPCLMNTCGMGFDLSARRPDPRGLQTSRPTCGSCSAARIKSPNPTV